MTAPPDQITITLRATPSGHGTAAQRLRGALKTLLRRYGLRWVETPPCAECQRLKGIVDSLAAQSEVLTGRAEGRAES